MEDDEIVEGYLDGLNDERKEITRSNRSPEYLFGWENGRDDRLRQPRASAETIRAQCPTPSRLSESDRD